MGLGMRGGALTLHLDQWEHRQHMGAECMALILPHISCGAAMIWLHPSSEATA